MDVRWPVEKLSAPLETKAEDSSDSASWTFNELMLAGGAAIGVAAAAYAGRGRIAAVLARGLPARVQEVTGESLAHSVAPEVQAINSMVLRTTPEFTELGNLQPGMYQMDWTSFRAHFGGTPERAKLLGNFESVLQKLRAADVKEVHVGGSFVTKKAAPGDIDFAWNQEQPYNRQVLLQFDSRLVGHDSLRSIGLQNLTDPSSGGTYKSIVHFLSQGHIEKQPPLPASLSNVPVREIFRRSRLPVIDKGVVELDLTRLP